MKKDKYEEYEEYDDEEYEEEPRKRHWFNFGCIIVIALMVGMVFLAYMVFQCYQEVDGESELGATVTVPIPDGATAGDIATALAENGIVKRDWLFKFYTKYSGKASALQPGNVDLKPGMGYNDILNALSVQRVFRSTITITFPEGTTCFAIADMMEQNELCSAEDFLKCANGLEYTETDGTTTTADYGQYAFWKELMDNPNPKDLNPCEGYLFPNTYEFYTDDSIYNLVGTFYREFDDEISGLTDAIAANPDDCINSINDAVILASFIQEEAGNPQEDPKVSAVFHNRLESSDPLWAEHRLESNACSYITNDADNNYVWNWLCPYYGWSEIPQDVIDTYDTYTISGLPAGAITNPGYESLEAALNPDQDYISEGYYFFVTDAVTGEYYYAKTADEHLANCQKAGWA